MASSTDRVLRTPAVRLALEPEIASAVQPLLGIDGRSRGLRSLAVTDIAAERTAAIEREARERGFAFGEREAREAMRPRVEARLSQLAATIETIAGLRAAVLRHSERDLVKLAVAIAERVVRREIQGDRDLILQMAHAAVERLGTVDIATIHVNPDDLSAMSPRLDEYRGTGPVRLVADTRIAPGGCLIVSDTGTVDAAIDAQFKEIHTALLGGVDSGGSEGAGDDRSAHG
jgi:flagellar biosynthesis/type III secretory pathway protein FliH